jgi:anti-anti-sigma factor
MQSIQFDKTYLDDGLVHLEISGPVNPATTGQFSWIIWGLFAQKSYRILLDLSKVSTIDSTGIGVLVNATETAQENGGDLVIVNPSEKVRWCVKTLNLGSYFTFADTRAEAEKRFATGKPGAPGA